MSDPKIVVIGAGSAIFGPGTLRDILVHPALHGSEVALVDIDAGQLEEVHEFGERMNSLAGAECRISATTDRRKALKGADFVVVSVAVDRERLWKLDFQIPLQLGVKQVLGENGGPGGLSHALRNIPLLFSICRDIEELAPDAWVINFTNPMSRLCMALARETRLRFVGLCHQIGEGYRIVSKILGIPREELRLRAAGLNHFTWIQDIRDLETGDDLYPLFWEKLESGERDYQPLSRLLGRVHGLYPAVGDAHAGEYIPDAWRYVGTEGYDFARYEKKVESLRRSVRAVAAGDAERAELWLSETSGERAVPVIVALKNDENRYEEAVNVVNRGAIPNLPDDAIVEVPAMVSAHGVQAIRVPPLPCSIAALCRLQISIQELVVRAAVSGSREAALQALVLDPVVGDTETASTVLDRLLAVRTEPVVVG